MYWAYLCIFILIVFSPEIIQREFYVLSEDDFEAFIIFLLGMVAFLLYLVKERELVRVVRDLLRFKKQAIIASENLQDSYSYIGEMNRKVDVMRKLFLSLPRALESLDGDANANRDLFHPVFDALKVLTKTQQAVLWIVDMRKKEVMFEMKNGECSLEGIKKEEVFREKRKTFWTEKDRYIACSENTVKNLRAYMLFPKAVNAIDDSDMIKTLAADALFLYSLLQKNHEGDSQKKMGV